MREKRYVVALTGASGSAYGRRLLDVLSSGGSEIHLLVSEAAAKVAAHELHLSLDPSDPESWARTLLGHEAPNVIPHAIREVEAPTSSGSYPHDGMVIVPCSMGTLGRVAHGLSSNVVERAADVCLKERRKLILVPRETPYSMIHLENMLAVTRAGGMILPASPGLYSGTDSVERIIDFVVCRILDHLGVENNLMQRYGEAARKRHPEDD